MGPFIILDKSFIQALSPKEVDFLFKHYSIIIVPTLINEIIADLKKGDKKEMDEATVISLSKKISPSSHMYPDYKVICLTSLLGANLPMNGKIINYGAELYDTPHGKAIFKDENPIMKIIRKWQVGNFSDMDVKYAAIWRFLSKFVNYEKTKPFILNIIKKSSADIPKVSTYQDLDFYVTATIDAPEQQKFFLDSILEHTEARPKNKVQILRRWEKLERPLIKQFAPYAYYCIKLRLLFNTGVISGLIGTKATNAIDLEYFFYLPYTWIFVSCDKFHKNLSQILLREDQVFIDGKLLKEDLKRIVERWESLSEDERQDDVYNYGSYPPPNESSITHKMWKQYMKPWKSASGNIVSTMTEEKNY